MPPSDEHHLASDPSHPSARPPELLAADLEELVKRRVPLGKRIIQASALVVLIAVVVVAITSTIRQAAQQATSASRGPVVLISNVAQASVSLNGRALSGSPPLILPVRSGDNTIALKATPFLPVTCQLRTDGQTFQGGTCQATGLYRSVRLGLRGRTLQPGLVIELDVTDADLPPNLAASARAAALQALNAGPRVTAVAPGEYIATETHWPDAILSEPAFGPMQAEVSYSLFDPVDSTPRPSACFTTLCAGTPFTTDAPATSGATWSVVVDANMSWTFRAADGAVIDSGVYPLIPAPRLVLAYTASTGWQVAPPAAQPGSGAGNTPAAVVVSQCGTGGFALQALTQQRGDSADVLADHHLAGCEVRLRQAFTGSSDGVFLWRFGVLLAVDAAAHESVPKLPIAPAVELDAFKASG